MVKYAGLAATAAVTIGMVLLSGKADAAVFNPIVDNFVLSDDSPVAGNPCSGASFSDCSYDNSLAIFKFNFNDDGSIQSWEGASFNQVSADDFTFEFSEGSFKWTYWADADDPGITAFAVKAGNEHNIYEKQSPAFLGMGDWADGWTTPDGKDISHIVFFDSLTPIPLPAGLVLLLSGLAGIGFLGRYKAKRRELATV